MKEYLREATKDDVDLLFKWTNDPAVRKNSFSSEKLLMKSIPVGIEVCWRIKTVSNISICAAIVR